MTTNAGEASLPVVRVVAGVVAFEGRILAARRGPSMSLAGYWELPGGKVEPGETDADALVRELREELDIVVTVLHHLGTSRATQPERVIELVAYHCELTEGRPAPSEHDELRWVRHEDLGALGWAPADVPLLSTISNLLEPCRKTRP